jgi:hypothetical protein
MFYNLICIFLYALLSARNFILVKCGCYSHCVHTVLYRSLTGLEKRCAAAVAMELELNSCDGEKLSWGDGWVFYRSRSPGG